jgi:hypothetical protein
MSNMRHLVDKFAEHVIAQADATNARVANKHTRKYADVFRQLRSHGDEGRAALRALLEHDRSEVRVIAAGYLLRYCTDAARHVLMQEAAAQSILAFIASETLRRWDRGEWNLDPA